MALNVKKKLPDGTHISYGARYHSTYYIIHLSETFLFFFFSISVNHRSCIANSSFVRANAILSGFICRPIKGEPNKCFLTRLICLDPKGMIPAFVVSAGKKKAAFSLLTLYQFVAEVAVNYPPEDISASTMKSLETPPLQTTLRDSNGTASYKIEVVNEVRPEVPVQAKDESFQPEGQNQSISASSLQTLNLAVEAIQKKVASLSHLMEEMNAKIQQQYRVIMQQQDTLSQQVTNLQSRPSQHENHTHSNGSQESKPFPTVSRNVDNHPSPVRSTSRLRRWGLIPLAIVWPFFVFAVLDGTFKELWKLAKLKK